MTKWLKDSAALLFAVGALVGISLLLYVIGGR